MTRNRLFIAIGLIVFVGIVLGVLAMLPPTPGVTKANTKIEYEIPTGFRGAFVIATNQKDGEKMNAIDGTFVAKIPKNGVFRINGNGPFFQPVDLELAAFDNKTKLTMYTGTNEGIRAEELVLKCLFTRSDDTIWYFVGTLTEIDDALKQSELKVDTYIRKNPDFATKGR